MNFLAVDVTQDNISLLRCLCVHYMLHKKIHARAKPAEDARRHHEPDLDPSRYANSLHAADCWPGAGQQFNNVEPTRGRATSSLKKLSTRLTNFRPGELDSDKRGQRGGEEIQFRDTGRTVRICAVSSIPGFSPFGFFNPTMMPRYVNPTLRPNCTDCSICIYTICISARALAAHLLAKQTTKWRVIDHLLRNRLIFSWAAEIRYTQ